MNKYLTDKKSKSKFDFIKLLDLNKRKKNSKSEF